ncbi:MAG: DUF3575 domain-containing protein [Bacteroidota bacterium]|nr:DUF3575 domain-containing protein [Bacteroidota bacterium]
MKKHYFTLAFVVIVAFTYAQKNVVSIRPINFAEGLYGLSYERSLLKWFSAGLYIDVQQTKISGLQVAGYKADLNVTGFGIVPEARFYLSLGGAPNGFFLGAYLPIRQMNSKFTLDGNIPYIDSHNPNITTYAIASNSKTTFTDNRLVYGIGGMLGYHFILLKMLSIELMAGAAYTNGMLNDSYKTQIIDNNTGKAKQDVGQVNIPYGVRSFFQIQPRFGINLGIAF